MASFEVISTDHSSSGSFPSGEYSFLPEVSAPHYENGIENQVNGVYDLTNMASALATSTPDLNNKDALSQVTSSPDLSVEEVHSRLVEILNENQSLKESLNTNNTLMKAKMSTISDWRDQMLQCKSQLEQKLKVAEEKNSFVQKENADLTEKLGNLEQACAVLKSQPCKNCKSLETALKSLQDENMSVETSKNVLVEELGGMAKFHEQFKQNLLAIYNQLHNLLRPGFRIPDKEKEELKAQILCLGSKIGILDGDTSDYLLQGSCVVENLRKDLEARNKELDIFRKREQEMSEIIKAYDRRLEESEKQQRAASELLNNKLTMQTSLSEKYKQRSDSLLAQKNEYELKLESAKMYDPHELQQLRDEAKNLQEILKLEQRANQKDKDKLAEVMEKCEQLQVDYERVTKLLEIQSRDEKIKNEELSTLRETSARSHIEEVDHLTAQLLELEDKFADKCEEIQKLREDLETLRNESETIPILKAQIEVYKLDLEHAVCTRDTAHAEIEQLESKLRKYKRHDSDQSTPGRRRSSHGHKMEENKGQDKHYECPVCGMAFTNPESTSNHFELHHNTQS